MIDSKLYRCLSDAFSLPDRVEADGQVIGLDAPKLPVLYWPDGAYCFEATAYLLERRKGSRSVEGEAGPTLNYACHISHLLRYCWRNNRRLEDIDDAFFNSFARLLQDGQFTRRPLANNSLNAILYECLRFLEFVGELYGLEDFVGPRGAIQAATASKKPDYQLPKYAPSYWHRSMSHPSPYNKREPISTESIEALRKAVLPVSTSLYLRKRRYVMIRLLEVTGGRRGEVSRISVSDIYRAYRTKPAMLKLCTLKHRGPDYREIPIGTHDLDFFIEFISINRKRLVQETVGSENDTGALLLSEKTGLPLRPNTITQEISLLANHAGLETRVSPHLFRHRFITKMFLALLEQHRKVNGGTFRENLLEAQALIEQVKEWSGHQMRSSLDRYLHLAVTEFISLPDAVAFVGNKVQQESLRNAVAHTLEELTHKAISAEEALSRVLTLTSA